jgi:hypothetical protein
LKRLAEHWLREPFYVTQKVFEHFGRRLRLVDYERGSGGILRLDAEDGQELG